MIQRIRPGLARGRNLAEQGLHPLRRRRARRTLNDLRRPSILFICKGNICRSPFAAGLLGKLQAEDEEGDPLQGAGATSAGFIRPGRRPPPEAERAAADRDVDLSGHRSRLVTRAMVEAHRLVVVMEAAQVHRLRRCVGSVRPPVVVLGDLDPGRIPRRTILDPVDQPPPVFEACYDRIQRCVEALHERVTTHRPGAFP